MILEQQEHIRNDQESAVSHSSFDRHPVCVVCESPDCIPSPSEAHLQASSTPGKSASDDHSGWVALCDDYSARIPGCLKNAWLSLGVPLCVPVGDYGMLKYNALNIFALGNVITACYGDDVRWDMDDYLGGLIQQLSWLSSNHTELSGLTRNGAGELCDAANEYRVDRLSRRIFLEKLARFDDAIRSEFESLSIYYIPQVQAYNTRMMLEEGERLLPEDACRKLAQYPQSLDDMRKAARCVTMSLWTACGFHAARATEGLIRVYFEQECGDLPPEGTGRAWVKLVQSMSEKKCGDPKLIEDLISVGKNYRNPLMHPDDDLDANDGPILLSACIGAMTKILGKLP